MKPLIYVAHPVTGDPKGNAKNTIDWVRAFVDADPGRIYIAPWVAEVMGFLEEGHRLSPEFYQRVLDDDCEVVARCDGLVGVGGKWSGGMLQERAAAMARKIPVLDLTRMVRPMPEQMSQWQMDELWRAIQPVSIPKEPY